MKRLTPEQRAEMLRKLKYGPRLGRKARVKFAAKVYASVTKERAA